MRGRRWAGLPGDLYQDADNLQRVRALPDTRRVRAAATDPGVSVAVLNLERPDLILPLLGAVEAIHAELTAHGLGFELLLGDTGSKDPKVRAALAAPPAGATVVTDMTYHFSRTNNDLCDGRVRYDHLLLLNNDVLLRGASPLLLMHREMATHQETGIVGLVMDLPDGSLQHAGVDLVRSGQRRGLPVHPGYREPWSHRPGRSWPVIAVTGAALMIRTALWERLSGLDESYRKECQDVDLCLRALRLGHGSRVVDAGPLVHEENGTRPRGEAFWPDRRLFLRRWRSFTAGMNL